jgi:hypothetical protein
VSGPIQPDNAGRKDDHKKVRLDLLPPDALLEVGKVLTFGADKYADRNWERGMDYGRVLGASLRHTLAIMRGEDHDPETGLLHASHLACCALFLAAFQLRGIGNDDRNKLKEVLAGGAGDDILHTPLEG